MKGDKIAARKENKKKKRKREKGERMRHFIAEMSAMWREKKTVLFERAGGGKKEWSLATLPILCVCGIESRGWRRMVAAGSDRRTGKTSKSALTKRRDKRDDLQTCPSVRHIRSTDSRSEGKRKREVIVYKDPRAPGARKRKREPAPWQTLWIMELSRASKNNRRPILHDSTHRLRVSTEPFFDLDSISEEHEIFNTGTKGALGPWE